MSARAEPVHHRGLLFFFDRLRDFTCRGTEKQPQIGFTSILNWVDEIM